MSTTHESPATNLDPIPYVPDVQSGPASDRIIRRDGTPVSQRELIPLYQTEDFEAAHRYATSMDKETMQRLEKILAQLGKANRWRTLTPAVAPKVLLDLKLTFPNFSEVIEEVAMHLALAHLNGANQAILSLPPILLVGPPGVGKSYFARCLSQALGARFWETSLSTNTAGFMLSGLDVGWSNGKPGLVFNALLESPDINPMILLDEIDKANSDSKSDPLGALYSLLEPTMAKRFRDEAVTLPIDASHILWVATANDIGTIPEPLISRMTVFEIPMPDAKEAWTIARGIWSGLRANEPWGRFFLPKLEDEVVKRLEGESPRVMGKLLTRAAGRAILEHRQRLVPDDVRGSNQPLRRMGF
jgi:ATP-dependent Lon protease